jgi:hypothetical protein
MADMAIQFAFSSTAAMIIGYRWMESQKRSRDSLRRMMDITEGTLVVSYESSEALRLPVQEFDDATGVNGEDETRRLFTKVTSRHIAR